GRGRASRYQVEVLQNVRAEGRDSGENDDRTDNPPPSPSRRGGDGESRAAGQDDERDLSHLDGLAQGDVSFARNLDEEADKASEGDEAQEGGDGARFATECREDHAEGAQGQQRANFDKEVKGGRFCGGMDGQSRGPLSQGKDAQGNGSEDNQDREPGREQQ